MEGLDAPDVPARGVVADQVGPEPVIRVSAYSTSTPEEFSIRPHDLREIAALSRG